MWPRNPNGGKNSGEMLGPAAELRVPMGSISDQHHILERLVYTEMFEKVLQTRYQGTKRFSLEGLASLIPLLDEILKTGAEEGVIEGSAPLDSRRRLSAPIGAPHSPHALPDPIERTVAAALRQRLRSRPAHGPTCAADTAPYRSGVSTGAPVEAGLGIDDDLQTESELLRALVHQRGVFMSPRWPSACPPTC